MSITKKILSTLLVLSMLLPMAVSCQNDTASDETETNDKLIESDDKTAETDSSALNVEGILLVDSGKTEYVIVRGENAAPAEVTASTELQSYLKLITGVEIPIVTDTTAETELEIVVGKTNREADGDFDRSELGDDGFVIKTTENKLWLVGGEVRGTLYSVYEFLEAYLGCRFYAYDCEKIPELATIQLEDVEEDKQIPVFTYRATDAVPSRQGYFQTKLRLNALYNSTDPAYGGRIGGNFGHMMNYLLPASVYYADHPEYFSGPEALENNGQPCLSNPEVIEIITEAVRKHLNENPTIQIMHIGQNDNYNYCTCDACNAICEEEGSQSGVLLRFMNIVATELKDEFPDVTFTTFAYQYTRIAPNVTKPVENVGVVLCSIEGCFSHPLSENVERECHKWKEVSWRPTISTDAPAWSAICDKLYFWDYTTDYCYFNMYFPNFNVMLDNVQFFADNNAKGVYEEGNYKTDAADFPELRAYILSKILWDPYMTEEEYNYHINDFLEGFYGPGWEHIRAYMDMAQEIYTDSCMGIYDDQKFFNVEEKTENNPKGTYPAEITEEMIRNYTEYDWSQYWNWYSSLADPGDYITYGTAYFESAMAEAETDEQRARIDKASLQVVLIDSMYRERLIWAGKGGMNNLIKAYFEDNADLFTKDEQSAYRKAISELAQEQINVNYIEFNKTLRERLMSHGITRLSEGNSDLNNESAINYSKAPGKWFS